MPRPSGGSATPTTRWCRTRWRCASWSASRKKVARSMPTTFQLLLNGSPADDDLYAAISSLEVEENADLPDAIQLDLPVNRTEEGDLTFVGDDRFGPFANVAVLAQTNGAGQQCIFDGYVLSQKLHLESGTTA